MKLRIRSLFYHLICLSLLQVWTSAKEVFPDIYTDPENVQKLLNNSRLHKNRLVFREGEKKYGNEKTNKNCRADMKSWMGSLSTVKELGKCDRSEANCTATLKLLNSYARFPSSNHPNIYEGSYEQCLSLNNENSLSFETKYCYLIHWDQKNKSCQEDSYSVLLKPNRTAFAICGPKSCQGKDYQVMFDNLQKPFDFMIDRPVCAAFCANRDIPQSKTYFIVTSFIILVVFLVCSATLWDYMKDKKYKIVADQDDVPCQKAILAWSMWSNIGFLFKEHGCGYIKVLDPIRALTFTWVVGQNVVEHLAFYDDQVRAKNAPFPANTLTSLIPVYTYLFISGLTLTYTFIKAKHSLATLKNPITWIVFYFHRWIRLTCALVFTIAIFDTYGKFIQGPYDALTGYSIMAQISQCTFWKDILHISNFVEVDKMCYVPAWHLAVDFQFTLVAPLFLMSFWYSGAAGTVISLICALLSSGSLIFFYWKHDYLKPAFIGNHELDDHLVEIILSKPWNQMAPYMYGMISGYVLANYRGKSFSFHPFPVTIIWIIAITLGILTIISSNFWDDCVKDCWLRNASINLTTRFVWTICLAWIIVATHLKWAGPLTNFLEHPFWRPFGRLSFCAFITHYIIIYYVFNLDEQAPFFVSFWYNFFHFILPISTFSFVTAAFLSLLIELPMMRMDKLLYERFLPSPHHDEADEKNEEKEPTLDEDYGDEDVDVEEKVEENDEGPLLNHEF